jgi:hypothetical protein
MQWQVFRASWRSIVDLRTIGQHVTDLAARLPVHPDFFGYRIKMASEAQIRFKNRQSAERQGTSACRNTIEHELRKSPSAGVKRFLRLVKNVIRNLCALGGGALGCNCTAIGCLHQMYRWLLFSRDLRALSRYPVRSFCLACRLSLPSVKLLFPSETLIVADPSLVICG